MGKSSQKHGGFSGKPMMTGGVFHHGTQVAENWLSWMILQWMAQYWLMSGQGFLWFSLRHLGVWGTRPGERLHSNGKSSFFYGKIHYKWPFSIAMLVHQRVLMNCRRNNIGHALDGASQCWGKSCSTMLSQNQVLLQVFQERPHKARSTKAAKSHTNNASASSIKHRK